MGTGASKAREQKEPTELEDFRSRPDPVTTILTEDIARDTLDAFLTNAWLWPRVDEVVTADFRKALSQNRFALLPGHNCHWSYCLFFLRLSPEILATLTLMGARNAYKRVVIQGARTEIIAAQLKRLSDAELFHTLLDNMDEGMGTIREQHTLEDIVRAEMANQDSSCVRDGWAFLLQTPRGQALPLYRQRMPESTTKTWARKLLEHALDVLNKSTDKLSDGDIRDSIYCKVGDHVWNKLSKSRQEDFRITHSHTFTPDLVTPVGNQDVGKALGIKVQHHTDDDSEGFVGWEPRTAGQHDALLRPTTTRRDSAATKLTRVW